MSKDALIAKVASQLGRDWTLLATDGERQMWRHATGVQIGGGGTMYSWRPYKSDGEVIGPDYVFYATPKQAADVALGQSHPKYPTRQERPDLYECSGCAPKPGSPVLCLRCQTARDEAGGAWIGSWALDPSSKPETDALPHTAGVLNKFSREVEQLRRNILFDIDDDGADPESEQYVLLALSSLDQAQRHLKLAAMKQEASSK